MSKFDIVKRFYDLGAWNIDRVRNAVEKGWIDEGEFETITGQQF